LTADELDLKPVSISAATLRICTTQFDAHFMPTCLLQVHVVYLSHFIWWELTVYMQNWNYTFAVENGITQ
jgi:hypothetical protein